MVSFAVAISTSHMYILDSGARRIALLPAHLHGGSPTCCCGSGFFASVGGARSAWVGQETTKFNYYEKRMLTSNEKDF